MASDLFTLRLDRTHDAPSRARAALSEWLGPRVAHEELERARLLLSELVTNAVIHGKGAIEVHAGADADRVLIEVIDEGHGFEHQVRAHDFDRVGGKGLAIVDSEASRWGIHEGTTHVWCEIERAGPRLGEEENPLS